MRINGAGEVHPLQLARTINHQGPVLAYGQGHVLVRPKVRKLAACVLLGDEHPVEPGARATPAPGSQTLPGRI